MPVNKAVDVFYHGRPHIIQNLWWVRETDRCFIAKSSLFAEKSQQDFIERLSKNNKKIEIIESFTPYLDMHMIASEENRHV